MKTAENAWWWFNGDRKQEDLIIQINRYTSPKGLSKLNWIIANLLSTGLTHNWACIQAPNDGCRIKSKPFKFPDLLKSVFTWWMSDRTVEEPSIERATFPPTRRAFPVILPSIRAICCRRSIGNTAPQITRKGKTAFNAFTYHSPIAFMNRKLSARLVRELFTNYSSFIRWVTFSRKRKLVPTLLLIKVWHGICGKRMRPAFSFSS